MHGERVLAGTILYGEEPEVVEGYLCIKDNIITEVGEDYEVDAHVTGLIAPCFVNAHTHVGDSVLKDPPVLDLDSLIKPPFGLKHRVLNSSSIEDLKIAIQRTLADMAATGTCAFCDFREGGIAGATILNDVMADVKGIEGKVMGRPAAADRSEPDELEKLMEICSGIGISGVNDIPAHILEDTVNAARKAGRMFAIHAGEKDTSDITAAIQLEPDFIVHMTHASHDDIRHLAAAGISAVVCPRSNFIIGVGSPCRPPIRKMLDEGIPTAVGTDNVMLNSVNMFAEMEFLSKVYRLDDKQVFKLCTLNGAGILGVDHEIGSIQEGKQAKLMVINVRSDNLSNSSDLLASFVRRVRPDDIKTIIR